MGGTTGLADIARAVTIAQQEEASRQSQRETSFPGLAREDLVTSAYRDILGRNPEPAGLQHSINAMISGMTGGDLVRGFIGTPEFQQAQDYQRAFTRAFRPGYQQFGPNQQFYPSIYRPIYTDYGIEGAVNFPRPAYGYDESLYQLPALVSPTTPRTPTPQPGGIFGIAPGSTTATSNVPQTVFPQANVPQAIVPQTVFPQGATGIVGYTRDNQPIYSEPRVYSVSGSGAGGSSVAAGESNVLQSPLKPHISTEGSVNVFGRVQDQGIVGYTGNNDPIYSDPRIYSVSGSGAGGSSLAAAESNVLQSPLQPYVSTEGSTNVFGRVQDQGIVGYTGNNEPIFSTPAFNSPQTEITMGNLPHGGFYKGGQVDDGIASLLKR